LIKPPTQPSIGLDSFSATAPIQSLTGIQNRTGDYNVIPVLFGKNRVYPIILSAFTEIFDNQQYLRMLFLVGYEDDDTKLELSDFKIGETALENYTDVEMAYNTRFADMSDEEQNRWFPNIVQTDLNVSLTNAASWQTQTTETDSTGIIVDITFPSLVGYNSASGAKYSVSVNFEIQYRPTGSSDWIPFAKEETDLSAGSLDTLTQSRFNHTSSRVGSKIYAIGGAISAVAHTTSIEEYDIATNTWTTKTGVLPQAIEQHAAVVVGTDIYIFGGNTVVANQNKVYKYDTVADSVSTLADMPASLTGVQAIQVKNSGFSNLIFVYGGYNGSNAVASLYAYSISGNSWTTITPSYTGSSNASLRYRTLGAIFQSNEDRNSFVIAGGLLQDGSTATANYLGVQIGGTSANPTALVYTADEKINLPEARYFHAVAEDASDPGQVYFAGGITGGGYSDEVIKSQTHYPYASSKLTDTMDVARAGLGFNEQSGTLFIDGGTSNGSTALNTMLSSDNASKTITGATATTLRKSYRIEGLTADQYDVRIRRTTADSSSNYIQDVATWTAIRSIKSSDAVTFPYAKTVALRIKASEQLNGVLDSFNFISETYLPVYSGGSWVTQKTRNPAWAYSYVLRGIAAKEALADAKVDTTSISDWATNCDSDNFYYDKVWESETVSQDILQEIAAVGRASVSYFDDKIGVIQDKAISTYTQLFSPRNIVKNSFVGSKAFTEVPHALKVRFKNSEQDYIEDERVVYRDGYNADGSGGNTIATNIEEITYPGITTSDQVYRRARYDLAVGVLRPEIFSFKTPFAHLVATRGDKIRLQHDAAVIGLGGARITALDSSGGNIDEITIDNSIQTSSGTDYTIRVKAEDGDVFEETVTVASTGLNNVFNITTPSNATGSYAVGDHVLVGEDGEEGIDAIISEIRYDFDLIAEITAVPYNASLYDVDSEAIPAYSTVITKTQAEIRGEPPLPGVEAVVSDEFVMIRGAGGSLSPAIKIDITPFNGTGGVPAFIQARARRTDDYNGNYVYSPQANAEDNTVKIPDVEEGATYDIYVRYVSKDFRAGPWALAEAGHTVTGKSTLPPDVSNFSITFQNTGFLLTWDTVTVPDFKEYIVKVGASWSAGTIVATTKTNELFVDATSSGSYNYHVKAVDDSVNSNESETEATLSFTVNAPGTPINASGQSLLGKAILQWSVASFSSPRTEYGIRFFRVYRSLQSETFSDAVLINEVEANYLEYQEPTSNSLTYYIKSVDFAGNESATAAEIDLNVSDPVSFILVNSTTDSQWISGTATNLEYLEDGVYPLLHQDAWTTVHSNNGWTTIQDQIDDYPDLFVQPTQTSGSRYVRTFDLGVAVTDGKVTVQQSITTFAGSLTVDLYISLSTDGVHYKTYTNPPSDQVVGSNFRFIVVDFRYSGTDETVARLNNYTISVNAVPIQETGSSTTDIGGFKIITPKNSFNAFSSVTITATSGYPRLTYTNTTLAPTSFNAYVTDTNGVLIPGEDFTYVIIGY
jgi:predicted phage tail protein